MTEEDKMIEEQIQKQIDKSFDEIFEIDDTKFYEKFEEDLSKYEVPKYKEETKRVEEFKTKTALVKFIDYKQMGNDFIKIQPLYYDELKNWWLWNFKEHRWVIVDDVDIMNAIDRHVKPSLQHDTSKPYEKSRIIETLKKVGRLNKPKELPLNWIQFNNKLVDIYSGRIFNATPNYMTVNMIPWGIGKTEETPIFDKLFTDWVGKDNIQKLYEVIAYCLCRGYPLQRLFCLVGEGSNGKSTFIKVSTKFLGEHNTTNTSLDLITSVSQRFESSKLFRKLLCIMSETNYTTIRNTEMLKTLTGGDRVRGEFKNKKPFEFENYAKIIIATNRLPATFDKTDAWYRRWYIIDFPNKFSEKRDILSEIPDIEYENLSRKCIKIIRNLLTKREFYKEGTIAERERKYEETSNPVLNFISQKCIKGKDFGVPFDIFFLRFEDYIKEPVWKDRPSFSKNEVSRILTLNGYKTKVKGYKKPTGGRSTRVEILGIKLND